MKKMTEVALKYEGDYNSYCPVEETFHGEGSLLTQPFIIASAGTSSVHMRHPSVHLGTLCW